MYDVVDSQLSCSNAGGRRGRSIRDQLFIVYGLINDVINGKEEPIHIDSYDVVMCFDKLNFPETHNDLWDTNIIDDKFALLVELDRSCLAKVRTPVGETSTFPLRDIIMQGSVFSSLKCCVSVDTLGRDCLSSEEDVGLHTYKGIVSVPPLSVVDDILSVSKCGVKNLEANSSINVKIESKTLTLGDGKCKQIYIQKKEQKKNYVCVTRKYMTKKC